MREDLDESVLNGFVGFSSIAKILVRDAQCPTLVRRDELGEPFTGFVELAARNETPNQDREPRVLAERRGRGLPSRDRRNRLRRRQLDAVGNGPVISTHMDYDANGQAFTV
jgi:hypothetical protein